MNISFRNEVLKIHFSIAKIYPIKNMGASINVKRVFLHYIFNNKFICIISIK